MTEQVSVTANELQQGVRQLLEHYQRCGLTHVPASADPAQVQTILSSVDLAGTGPVTTDPSATLSSEHVPPASSEISAPETRAPRQGSQRTAAIQLAPHEVPSVEGCQPVSPGAEFADKPTFGNWNLPTIVVHERQNELDKVDARVKACTLCTDIVPFRRQTVFGDGTLQPTVCFFGEAPGADEDRVGKPFVGAAGQLLTKIIEAMGLKRSEVYILNSLKCRPPQNRTPVPAEIDNCRPFVESQLEILQPKYIVCLGAVAVRSLLQSSSSVGQLRGKFHRYRGARVVVTYHPAYLLRNESAKKLVWEDMQMLMRELDLKSGKPA